MIDVNFSENAEITFTTSGNSKLESWKIVQNKIQKCVFVPLPLN